ncbi:MAG: acyltransferase family protein [Prevotella sp.]
MENHSIDFSDLSRHRSVLMGVAMLMVMLFHVNGPLHDTLWQCALRCGNVGVDMFLFLSGIGLWFAWTKTKTADGCDKAGDTSCRNGMACRLKTFYLHRYRRIYPCWLLFACLYYIPQCVAGSRSVADTVADIAVNLCFWTHTELTFWFVPAIMMLYTVAPAYMELISHRRVWRWLPAVFMMVCVLIQYHAPLHAAVSHLEIFFSRIPIFLLGINAGELVMEKRRLDPSAVWFLLLVFAVSAAACLNFEDGLRGHFPLFLERMVYIPLTVSMLLLLCPLLDAMPQWLRGTFAFVGGISLEIYLVHYYFIYIYIRPLHLGFLLSAALTVGASLIAAWLVHICLPGGGGRRGKTKDKKR